jgi:hypothetical protein
MKLRTITRVLPGLAGLLAAACAGSPAGTGGSSTTGGTGGSTTGTGTSTSGTAVPDSAWVVNMTSGSLCALTGNTVQLGDVTAAAINVRVTDGEQSMGETASVACAVVTLSGGAFQVQALTSLGADSLQVNLPSITPGATMAEPAIGTITYASNATVEPYGGMCGFYFAAASVSEGVVEGVAQGKFWSAFTCAGITDDASSPPSTCPVAESYFVMENCGSSPIF